MTNKTDNLGFDELGRPSWPLYLMSIAFFIRLRSLDPNTKHGAVIVDETNAILSTGYNSPPRGCNDKVVPMERPSKYAVVSHAEVSAISLAAKRGISLNNSTLYITGKPCHLCLSPIINAGIKKVIYGPVQSKCIDKDSEKFSEILLSGNQLILEEFKYLEGLEKLGIKYV